MKKLFVLFTISLFASSLWAGPVKIEITNDGGMGALLNPLVSQLETDINKDFPDVDQSTYLEGMANAAATSTRGTGIDYASNMSLFMVGFGLGMGMDLGEGGSMSDFSQVAGIGVSGGFLVGLNLRILPFLPEVGPIDLKKSKLYVNFFSMDIPDIDDSLSGSMSTFGMHIQNKIIDPINLPLGVVKWYGVDVSTGFDYSSMEIQYVYDIKQTTDLGTGITATMAGPATMGAKISTFTIPVEASTSVGVLWIFNLYAGAGLDINFTKAESIANIVAPVSFTGTTASAKATLDLGDEGNGSYLDLRIFMGGQLDFTVMKLDVSVHKNITNNAMGVNFGTRVYW